MLLFSGSGLISILSMTLYFILVRAESSGHNLTDSTFNEENPALKIIHNMHTILMTGTEIEKPEVTTLYEGNNNPGTPSKKQPSLKELLNKENTTVQENQGDDVILNKMHINEFEEDYNNDINTNLKNWTVNPKNKWLPEGIGVATWYEISLTGKKVQQTGENGVEKGTYLQASTSKAVTFRKNSEIVIMLIGIRIILF